MRIIRAAVLAAVSVVAFQSAAPAEDAVIVTATRFPERALDAPIGMTVISAERIANSTATTLPELLSQEAGFISRDNSGSPDRQIDLRGFGITGDQNTLVLLNGQRMNEIEFGSIRWSSIPLANIERIEILRGSGAVLYGGNATGGTINIITKGPEAGARGASVGGAIGSYGTRELRGGINLAGEHLGFSLVANDQASDNYRANNRLEQQNVNGELRLFAPRGHLAFTFGVENQNLGLPGARTQAQLASDPRGASTPRDFAARDGARATLAGRLGLGSGEVAADLGWRDSVRTSLLKDYSGFGFPDSYGDTRSRVWTFTPRFKLPYEAAGLRHSLIVGFDFEDWNYDSRRATGLETLGTPNARILATQYSQAFYAQHNTHFGRDTKLTLGAREQRVEMAARDVVNPAAYASGRSTMSPGAWEASLRHGFTPATAVYGRVGRSFRVSTLDESYSQFGGPFFDAIVTLLKPQVSKDHEIGVEYRADGLRARASAFAMYLVDEIYFFAPTFSNINLPPTRRSGLELDASYAVNARLSLFGNLSYTEARFRSGVIGGVDVTGKTIPLVPREAANAGFAWSVAERTRLNGVLRYVGKQFYDNDQTNTFPTQMPAYVTADLKLTLAAGGTNIGFSVNNLFDKDYYTYAIRNGAGTSFNAYPQWRRSVLLTLEYRI